MAADHGIDVGLPEHPVRPAEGVLRDRVEPDYFVSTRQVEGACGGGDIYVIRMRGDGSFEEPRHLGCTVNSEFNEFSPFPLPQSHTGPVLYSSSTRPNGGEGGDIYMSRCHGGVFGPPEPVPGVNSPADDGHPNVRRDGLEIFFYSARSDLPGAQGASDIHVATRERQRGH